MLWKQYIKPLNLRGQATRLQALDSMLGPRPFVAQSRPPLDGAGLSQVRYLCITPPPHVTSHSDQSLHFEYPPSSANQEKFKHVWGKFHGTDKKHINNTKPYEWNLVGQNGIFTKLPRRKQLHCLLRTLHILCGWKFIKRNWIAPNKEKTFWVSTKHWSGRKNSPKLFFDAFQPCAQ